MPSMCWLFWGDCRQLNWLHCRLLWHFSRCVGVLLSFRTLWSVLVCWIRKKCWSIDLSCWCWLLSELLSCPHSLQKHRVSKMYWLLLVRSRLNFIFRFTVLRNLASTINASSPSLINLMSLLKWWRLLFRQDGCIRINAVLPCWWIIFQCYLWIIYSQDL